MIDELKLNSYKIYEIGTALSELIRDAGLKKDSVLTINVNDKDFKRIDEDLFYRSKQNENEKFEPSDDEIEVGFDNVTIKIINNG